MVTSRRLAFLVFPCVVALLSCGGLDTEEAQAECDSIRKSQAQCMNDAAYDSCVACYEDCGVDCAQLESCPLQFGCD
jgi:hypothetical protein